MKASKITKLIEDAAPINLAEKWDNVGYQIGSRSKPVRKVLLTLDVTEDVVNEAIDQDVDMIISHHPFFFKGIKQIDLDSYKGKLIKDLINNDINLYSAHTNLDKAENGINQYIAQRLGLINIKPLSQDSINNQFFKLIIYVPEDSLEEIKETLFSFEVGKANSDKYRNCTFSSQGTGTFEPVGQANPAIGKIDQLERVNEIKIETIIPEKDINKILRAIKKVHPYEEMAYDLFPVKILEASPVEGLGRIGNLPKPLLPEKFVSLVKERLDLEYLRQAGSQPNIVKKVAICTGAGSEFISLAKRKGADVLITGDLKYHEGQTAQELGLWVLDAGHFGTEKQVIEVFREFLQPIKNQIEIIDSNKQKDFILIV